MTMVRDVVRSLAAICVAASFSVLPQRCARAEEDAARPLDALRARLSADAPRIVLAKGLLAGCVLAEGPAAGGESVPIAFGAVGKAEVSVAAACVMGRGRAVCVGHEGFFVNEAARANAAFLRDCVEWLAGDGAPRTVFLDAAISKLRPAVEAALPGVRIDIVAQYSKLDALSGGAVFVCHPDSRTLQDAVRLRAFIKRGGGALCTVVGWGWHQTSGEKPFSSGSPFNAALGEGGIFTAKQYVLPLADGKFTVCDADGRAGMTGEDALRLVEGAQDPLPDDVSARCVMILGELMSALPEGDARLRPRLKRLAVAPDGDRLPSPEHPLTAERAKERVGMLLCLREWQEAPAGRWPAHPSAAVYPGLPSAPEPRVTRQVEVDLSVPKWHGTGLFAGAGEPLTVTLPEGAEKLGLKVRIGSTTCRNTKHAKWLRAPEVAVEIGLERRVTEFSSPFGGMVYVVVPDPPSASGRVTVTIGPACPAARFVEGRDSVEDWKAALRTSPAPVAEIESDVIALTVPAEDARNCADPREVLAVWREVLENDARLACVPAKRRFPERISFDVQLCAGYMHSGYPIMLPKHSVKHLMNAQTMRKGSQDDVWGFFHEMGHNHQNQDWTFDGTGEVTVNFFTLYNMERICGIKPMDTEKMKDPALRALYAQWKRAGRPFDRWKADPWLALCFFAELQQRYGWESFERLFAAYRALSDAERPKTDLEKRRHWCERLSRIVGEDLSPDFAFMLKE